MVELIAFKHVIQTCNARGVYCFAWLWRGKERGRGGEDKTCMEYWRTRITCRVANQFCGALKRCSLSWTDLEQKSESHTVSVAASLSGEKRSDNIGTTDSSVPTGASQLSWYIARGRGGKRRGLAAGNRIAVLQRPQGVIKLMGRQQSQAGSL